MKSNIIARIINKCLMKYCAIRKVENTTKSVYLTFDDGPEPGITEFVLEELNKYGFKATFFCTGKNAEKFPELMEQIKRDGHSVGNHSYGHRHAYELSSRSYVDDIMRADNTLNNTVLFRPPNGCLSLGAWLKLRFNHKIIYWSIASGDWRKETYNSADCKSVLETTSPGDIILFHFVNEFEYATRQLLPWYLNWLHGNGYKSEAL